ncbi:MAG TPA: alpha/beta fold hydrolase [Nitriliruptorales bacterium]
MTAVVTRRPRLPSLPNVIDKPVPSHATGPASRSASLGEPRVAEVAAGRIHARETGAGPTLVFVSGFVVNGDLWREVVPLLADRYRCVTVELPTGAHAEAVDRDWPLDAPGMGRILGDVLEALDLDAVTIVANDSGCAHTQALITSDHPANTRVSRIVFTSGDFFDHFPPPLFKLLVWLSRIPGGTAAAMASMRWRWARHLPISYGWTQHGHLADDLAASFLDPARRDRAVFADVKRHLLAFDTRDTNRFAESFGDVDNPVLFAWGADDRLFPLENFERAAALFPDARVEVVEGAMTFVPLDQPQRLAEVVADFVPTG